jgi:hypothetical protein
LTSSEQIEGKRIEEDGAEEAEADWVDRMFTTTRNRKKQKETITQKKEEKIMRGDGRHIFLISVLFSS